MMDLWFWYTLLVSITVVVLGIFLFRQKLRLRNLAKLIKHNNERLEQLQLDFGRFAPQEVIEHLTDGETDFEPDKRSVTVLFADIKGFTRMCDKMDPDAVVSILNGYFQCMTEALSKHHGEVTEMMGDGLLALFGAIKNNPWQVQDAVKGALAMRDALKEYNQKLKSQGLPELEIGIGIHQGEVLAGIMGNYKLSKFGVVGDTINVASRVEGLTRVLDVDLLVTENVKENLDARFKLIPMPAQQVKGKEEPIVTYYIE